MRLWSLHPKYLDAKGITAAWREGLLARAVLSGATRGYRHHPQLERFRNHPEPLAAINQYLNAIFQEAQTRGYHFNPDKMVEVSETTQILVTQGQVLFEQAHLYAKLSVRDPQRAPLLINEKQPDLNQVFTLVPGEIEPWERGTRQPVTSR